MQSKNCIVNSKIKTISLLNGGKSCLLVLHTKMQYMLTEHTYIKQIMFSAEGRQGNHDGKRRKWNMHANNMA